MRTQISSDPSSATKNCRTLFVSSSGGRSGNDGRSANTPLAFLADAVARVNAGLADRLLLRRGDVFTDPIGRWRRSGRSASARAVIGAYGPGEHRPIVRCRGAALELSVGETSGELHHVLVKGLHFVAAGRDPDEPGYDRTAPAATGICVRGPGVRRVTIEDCRVEQFDDDVLLEGVSDVCLRRCVLIDVSPIAGASAHQLAVYRCGGTVRVDACVFDQNAPVAGASHHHVFAPHGNRHVIVTGCVVSRSPGTALLLDASREVVRQNILIGNRLHIAVGGGEAAVTQNLILGGCDRASAEDTARRAGTPPHAIFATADDLHIERNVIAHRRRARSAAIVLASVRAAEDTRRQIGRARVCGNVVYRCGGGIEVCAGVPWRTVELRGNDLQRLAAGQPAIKVRDVLLDLIVRDNRYGMFHPADDAAMHFRLGCARLTFPEWRRQTDDTSIVLRLDGTAHAVRLPRRFIADARAQSGEAWRAHLSPARLIRRFSRAFDLPRTSEIPS